MNGAHAILSPSGAEGWMNCNGKPFMEKGLPDDESEYAAEGTAAHTLAQMCLTHGHPTLEYKGTRITVGHRTFEVTDEMAEHVQKYVNIVRALSVNGELLIEQKLPIGHITGEEGATGTSDAVVLAVNDDELIIVDLKYGQGVKVFAERNKQGMLYALGALEEYAMLAEWKQVRIIISQPRLDHLDEWTCPVEELVVFAAEVADNAWLATHMLSGETPVKLVAGEHCRKTFCKARAKCPELAAFVSTNVGADFQSLSAIGDPARPDISPAAARKNVDTLGPVDLAAKMSAIDVIEDWCKAVRGAVEKALLDGVEVPGFKLVQGKKGNRAWTDATAAEKMLKSFRLKMEQMYDMTLISPTTAEKVLKAKPKQWAKAITMIGQKDGKPSVAPESDKRPALVTTPVADDFNAVTDGSDLA